MVVLKIQILLWILLLSVQKGQWCKSNQVFCDTPNYPSSTGHVTRKCIFWHVITTDTSTHLVWAEPSLSIDSICMLKNFDLTVNHFPHAYLPYIFEHMAWIFSHLFLNLHKWCPWSVSISENIQWNILYKHTPGSEYLE